MKHNQDEVIIMSDQLFKLYKKSVLSKVELAGLIGVSPSYIAKSIARGYGIPN